MTICHDGKRPTTHPPRPGPRTVSGPVPERSMWMPSFDFEKLDVYQKAIERRPESRGGGVATQGRAGLRNQLERATISIPLNIAEGAGEYSRGDKSRFYRIARRSATECAAILEVVSVLNLVADSTKIDSGRAVLLRIVQMLTRMARAFSESGPETETPGPGAKSGPRSRLRQVANDADSFDARVAKPSCSIPFLGSWRCRERKT